mgnify:CR=1 FL=1
MQENSYSDLLENRRNPNGEIISAFKFVITLLAICLCLTILFTDIYNVVIVQGDSMMDTLYEGDYLVIDRTRTPKRGDIVVLDREEAEDDGDKVITVVIKRVIALPGDVIYTETDANGNTFLWRQCKGESEASVVEEAYLKDGSDWGNRSTISRTVIRDGYLYVMGDNRKISYDSRVYGELPLDSVEGVVIPWSIKIKDRLTNFFDFFNFR